MTEGPSGIMATEGVSEATQAFQAALDAETPTRSRRSESRREERSTQLEELFPNREMDRREAEGGANDDPEIVKQRRREARQQRDEDEPPPRDPTEGNDDDEDDEDRDEAEPDDEALPEPEPEDDEDYPEPEAIDPNLTVRVMIDGEPAEVTIAEALKGYIRQETFHRRLADVGQAAQAVGQQRTHLEQQLTATAQQAELLEGYITAVMPQEPDWNALFRADAANAAGLKFQWDQFQAKLSEVRTMRANAVAQHQQLELQRLHEFAHANRTWLANAHPEWKNEKTWRRDHDSMRRTARSAGYTDAEIAQLYDARAVTVLLKAAAYDRMMAAKPKPVRDGYAPSKQRGSTPSRNLSRSFERAEKRLSRGNSIRDAAAAFESILDNEG